MTDWKAQDHVIVACPMDDGGILLQAAGRVQLLTCERREHSAIVACGVLRRGSREGLRHTACPYVMAREPRFPLRENQHVS